jgi:hypothetical protein
MHIEGLTYRKPAVLPIRTLVWVETRRFTYMSQLSWQEMGITKEENIKLRGFSPRANYTGRETTDNRRS